jgi:imidazolonepropionase-like amidohydrolase
MWTAAMALASLVPAIPAQAEDILISGATLIDGTGRAPVPNSVILIQNGKIARVGSKGAVAVPAGTRVIDATGKFAIPGLMDANVHLYLDLRVEALARYEGRYDELIVEAAQAALKGGVTTVFDSLGPRAYLAKARNDINSGRKIGSRIFFAGNIIGMDNPVSGAFGTGKSTVSSALNRRLDDVFVEGMGSKLLWDPPEVVRTKIRAYLSRDVDFVKYLVSGHAPGEMHHLMFSPRVQKVLVEETHRAGKIIETHTTSIESLNEAIDQGVNLMQHCEWTGPVAAPPELVTKLARSKIACAILPHTKARQRWMAQNRPGATFDWSYTAKDQNLASYLAAGVNIVMSTDASWMSKEWYADDREGYTAVFDDPLQLGEGHFNWFVAMAERGMKPMDMLQAATIRVAKAYQVADRLGSLEPGKIADILLLDADPLDTPHNYRKINLVIKDGRVVDTAALPLTHIVPVPPAAAYEHSWLPAPIAD